MASYFERGAQKHYQKVQQYINTRTRSHILETFEICCKQWQISPQYLQYC